MSMQLDIFSDRQPGSMAEWQAAIDAEGYPLKLMPDAKIDRLSGFLPCHLGGELTGFECFHDAAADVMRSNADIDFGHKWKYCLEFVWLGSKWYELVSAWMAGTAFASLTGGVIFDCEAVKIVTPEQGRQLVQELEHPSAAAEAARQKVRRELGIDPWPKIPKSD
jgi:hypothetical protein